MELSVLFLLDQDGELIQNRPLYSRHSKQISSFCDTIRAICGHAGYDGPGLGCPVTDDYPFKWYRPRSNFHEMFSYPAGPDRITTAGKPLVNPFKSIAIIEIVLLSGQNRFSVFFKNTQRRHRDFIRQKKFLSVVKWGTVERSCTCRLCSLVSDSFNEVPVVPVPVLLEE